MSAPADLSGEEAAALEIMSKRFLLAMIASLTPSEFQRYRDALADVGVPLSSDLPVRVALDPDPSGVSVGVWQGPRCIYTGAHPLPAPAAGDALDAAARDVLAERQRQIGAEGWTPEHDDAYADEQLARAAVCYALPQGNYEIPEPPEFWPWDAAWWKPGDRRRELIKAGALILAEIERLDRAAIALQSARKVDA